MYSFLRKINQKINLKVAIICGVAIATLFTIMMYFYGGQDIENWVDLLAISIGWVLLVAGWIVIHYMVSDILYISKNRDSK